MSTRINYLFRVTLMATALLLAGCGEERSHGKLSLYLADSPVDAGNVEAVMLSIIRAEANGPEGWITLSEFDPPLQLNLLDYRNGSAYFLTENELPAGTYTEVRLILKAPQLNGLPVSNPDCYIRYADQSVSPLFAPSGAQTGYKAKGSFTIPEGGTVAVTLDFDLRKSIVKAGHSGNFLLKPTIRLVANQNAALIRGHLALAEAHEKVVAYAYRAGTFTANEATQPAEGEVRFPNAVTSATVQADGSFSLAFLEAGQYDLIFAALDNEGRFSSLIGKYGPVQVTAGAVIELTITPGQLTEL